MKIVTLLPSATEIVCALGMGNALVGVSHSCRLPRELGDLPRVTSTHVPYLAPSGSIDTFVREHLTNQTALYDLDLEVLATARPDVIVSQALCDVCAVSTGDVVEAVRSLPGSPALVDLEPNTLEDVFDDILRVGEHLGIGSRAIQLVDGLRERLANVATRSATIPIAERPRVLFLEWLEPPFSGGHWNPELVEFAGGINLLGTKGKPSTTLDWQEIVATRPDIIFVSCCGFDVDRALEDVSSISNLDAWNALPAVANGRVYVADGDAYFSCPGPSLVAGLEIMAHAFHPAIHPEPAAGVCHQVNYR